MHLGCKRPVGAELAHGEAHARTDVQADAQAVVVSQAGADDEAIGRADVGPGAAADVGALPGADVPTLARAGAEAHRRADHAQAVARGVDGADVGADILSSSFGHKHVKPEDTKRTLGKNAWRGRHFLNYSESVPWGHESISSA